MAAQRRRKDRIVSPTATPQERRTDYAIAPFDKAAHDMDKKWGIDRLPELVSVETAARYGKLMGDFNEAIDNADPETASKLAAIGIRALAAMDAEAQARGHEPCNLWEYDLDGFRFAIIEDNRRWQEIKAQRPDLVIFTMREAALALQMFHDTAGGLVGKVKSQFPGSEAINAKPEKKTLPNSWFEAGGDPIPF